MTTDITELAQREKFEAWWEREYKHLESSKYTDAVPHIKYGFWMAYQAGGAELVEALEKAQQRITQMESRTVTDWIEHDGKWRPESLGLDELLYLKTRKQELKIPYPAGKVKGWMHTGGDMDVIAYKLASPQSSTVTVKLTDINEYLAEVHDKTLNRALRLLAEGVRAGDVAAMRAAGIKWEAE